VVFVGIRRAKGVAFIHMGYRFVVIEEKLLTWRYELRITSLNWATFCILTQS